MRWDIDSLSGVWIVAGTFIAYCVACLVIGLTDKYRFRRAREQRAKYYLSQHKDRQENENNN